MPSSSTVGTVVGLAAFVLGVVGYTVFGWRFDGAAGPTVTAVAAVRVILAFAVTMLRR